MVKNQITQTDEKYFSRRMRKKGSISNTRKSIRLKQRPSVNSIIDTQSQDDTSEIGKDDSEADFEDKIFLNKDMMTQIKEILSNNNQRRMSTIKKIKGTVFTSQTLRRNRNSMIPVRLSDTLDKSPPVKQELFPYSYTEVRVIIEQLFDKLLACIGDDEMRRRFDFSFKYGIGSKSPSGISNDSFSPSSADVLNTKLLIFKNIKDKLSKIFMSTENTNEMYKQALEFIKDKIETEYTENGIDGRENILKIFK